MERHGEFVSGGSREETKAKAKREGRSQVVHPLERRAVLVLRQQQYLGADQTAALFTPTHELRPPPPRTSLYASVFLSYSNCATEKFICRIGWRTADHGPLSTLQGEYYDRGGTARKEKEKNSDHLVNNAPPWSDQVLDPFKLLSVPRMDIGKPIFLTLSILWYGLH